MRRREFLQLTWSALLAGAALAAVRPAWATTARPRVAVVGGGMAGLAAAHFLRDVDCLVLEAGATPGGRAWAGRHDLERGLGGQYLQAEPSGALKGILAALGLRAVEIPGPAVAVWHKGKAHLGTSGRTRVLVEEGGLEIYGHLLRSLKGLIQPLEGFGGASFDPTKGPLAELDRVTAAAWMAALGLPPALRGRVNVLCRDGLGAGSEVCSALALMPRLVAEFDDSPVPARLEDIPAMDPAGQASGLWGLVGGFGAIVAALARSLGGRVHPRCVVRAVRRTPDRNFEVTWNLPSGRRRSEIFQAVILALPAPTALKVAEEALSESQRDLLLEVGYSPYLRADLLSATPLWQRAFRLELPDGLACTSLVDNGWWQRTNRKGNPGRGGHVLTARCPLAAPGQQGFLSLDREAMFQRLVADVAKVLPQAQEQVEGFEPQRHLLGLPLLAPGAFARLADLHEATTGRLQLAGDYLDYPTLPAAAESGRLAARKVRKVLGLDG